MSVSNNGAKPGGDMLWIRVIIFRIPFPQGIRITCISTEGGRDIIACAFILGTGFPGHSQPRDGIMLNSVAEFMKYNLHVFRVIHISVTEMQAPVRFHVVGVIIYHIMHIYRDTVIHSLRKSQGIRNVSAQLSNPVIGVYFLKTEIITGIIEFSCF